MRMYTGQNPAIDTTKVWRELVVAQIMAERAAQVDAITDDDQFTNSVLEEAINLQVVIPRPITEAVEQYLRCRFGGDKEPVWLEQLLNAQDKQEGR